MDAIFGEGQHVVVSRFLSPLPPSPFPSLPGFRLCTHWLRFLLQQCWHHASLAVVHRHLKRTCSRRNVSSGWLFRFLV